MFWGICQSQNAFFRDWLLLHPQYLSELLESKANGVGVRCTSCSLWQGILCCTDCFSGSVWCKGCGLSSHMSLPFHRIQIWDGKCFIMSSLLEQGLVMHLGHNVQSFPVQRNPLDDDASMAGAEEEEEQEEDPPEDVSGIMGGQDTLVIAHSNGVFHHCIQLCACLGSSAHHIQLFRHGLFSASVICPKTAFTFDVLDHFYMDAMECKTASLSFFQKLRRFTNNAAPASVPVCLHHTSLSLVSSLMGSFENCYRELLHVSCQWRNLQALKMFGFGHGQS